MLKIKEMLKKNEPQNGREIKKNEPQIVAKFFIKKNKRVLYLLIT